jgi:hypothetical protein
LGAKSKAQVRSSQNQSTKEHMTNPNLTTDFSIPDPGAGWQPRTPFSDNTTATGSDPSGYARATMRSGEVFRTETGKALSGSTREVNEAQNQSARVPFEYATDPVTGCRVSPYELQEDTKVHFAGGQSMSIAQARAAGFLPPDWSRPGSGQLPPTNGAPNRPFDEGQEQPKEEVHPDLQVHLLANEAIDRDYSALVDSTGGVEQQQAIQQVVENGAIDPRTIGTLASQLRVEPEQLQGRVAPILEAFKQQALEVMGEGGLDANAVVAWAQQNKPDQFERAMHQQGTMRRTSGYAELRTEYLASLAEHSPSVALNAELGSGVTQYQDSKGRIIVRLADGNEMEWRTAITQLGVRKK